MSKSFLFKNLSRSFIQEVALFTCCQGNDSEHSQEGATSFGSHDPWCIYYKLF